MKSKSLLLILLLSQAFGQIKSCPKNFLCAKSCSLSDSEATEDARVEIAKNFQVEVKAKFTSIESTDGKLDESQYSDYVSEEVSETLFGVESIESFVDEEGYHCVLMGLNKTKFKEKLKSDISELKKENEDIYKTNYNLVLSKISANNSVIKKLDLFLATLSDKYSSNIVNYKKKEKKEINIALYSQQKFESIDKMLITELNKANVFDNDKVNQKLNIAIALKNEYLNVEGFVKRTLEVSFIHGKINITKRYTQTGRDEQAIILDLQKELSDDLPDVFLELKI